MIYILSYYVVLPLMMVVVPLLMLACFLCRGCEERRRRAADERQLRVARELRRNAVAVKPWPYDENHTPEDIAYFERLYTGVVLIKQRWVT